MAEGWWSVFALGAQGWGDELLRGLGVTVLLALVSYAIGLGLGLGAAVAGRSRLAALRALCLLYAMLVRGVPSLVLVYLLFYGLSDAVLGFLSALFGNAQQPPQPDAFWIGAITVGIVSGGFATEAIRGAWAALPKGQEEAALAYGMGRALRFRRVVLPQLLRLALPALGNVWQVTLKETSLIYVMGLVELMRSAQVASNSTRQPFTFFLAAALLYLAVTVVTTIAFDRAEKRAARPFLPRTG